MVSAFGKDASLTSLLLLSVMSTFVRSQAPGDASSSCTKSDVPDGMFMLLDTYWYRTLLAGGTSSPAGWTQTPQNSWAGQGNICARSLVSCDSSTNAWLVTQYISKSADVSYSLKITVDINGNTKTCSGCTSNDIKAYFYPSNGAISSGDQLNSNNYIPIGTITFNPTAATKSVTFSLESQHDRFYIAIVAESVCFVLRRMQVSYSVCSKDTEGLVVYPNTPIGAEAVTTSASCKENAEGSPSSSLSITCNTDGSYAGTPNCSCKGGYFLSGSTCFECAPGTYSEGSTCLDCPENSDSTEVASAVCACNEGFVRPTNDPSEPCVVDDPVISPTTDPTTVISSATDTSGGTNIVGNLYITTITALLLTAFLLSG